MKIVMMGPQGSGKGTQAKMLSQRLHIPHISTGDLLRDIARGENDFGSRVRKIIDAGMLVDDGTMLEIVRNRLARDDCKQGFILDGYPRTLKQVHDLEKTTTVNAVLVVTISENETIRRLRGRQTCKLCGAVYGHDMKEKRTGICDACGGTLYVRDDEHDEAIRKRLHLYEQNTKPVVAYYKQKHLVEEIDGERQPDVIFHDICRRLDF